MTPKEKAEKLIDRFEWIVATVSDQWSVTQAAKQCALITVDELIVHEKNHVHHKWVEYWQQVKKEINNYGKEI